MVVRAMHNKLFVWVMNVLHILMYFWECILYVCVCDLISNKIPLYKYFKKMFAYITVTI